MRRAVIAMLAMLAVLRPSAAEAIVRNVQDNHQVVYHVVDSSGDHVGSETVALQIKRVSDGFWFDFNDSTFKSSAWTSKSTNLTEDATDGFYHYTYNPPASETGPEQYQFMVDNASATYGDHQSEVASYQKIVSVAEVNAEADTALTDYDPATHTELISEINDVQTDVAALNDLSAAAVNTEVDTGLSDIGLDLLLSGTATLSADVSLGSVMGQLLDDGTAWTYDRTADSLEDLRDRGDAAWITAPNDPTAATIADAVWDEAQSGHVSAGTFGLYLDTEVSGVGGGGTITDILNVQPLVPPYIGFYQGTGTVGYRLGLQLTNALDDLPTTAEITPGTVSIDRKAKNTDSWSAVVTDAACLEAAGIVYYDEVFDSNTGYRVGDAVRVTFKSQKITVSANDYEVTDSNGVQFYSVIGLARMIEIYR